MNTAMIIEELIFDDEMNSGLFSVTHLRECDDLSSEISNVYGAKAVVRNKNSEVFLEFSNAVKYQVTDEEELIDTLKEYLLANMN